MEEIKNKPTNAKNVDKNEQISPTSNNTQRSKPYQNRIETFEEDNILIDSNDSHSIEEGEHGHFAVGNMKLLSPP